MKAFQLLIIVTSLTASCAEQAPLDGKERMDLKLSTDEDRCALVPDAGPCKAFFKKYYYDKPEDKCKEFIWGGCGGVVPFDTLEECEKCKNS